jgi:ribonuclease HII
MDKPTRHKFSIPKHIQYIVGVDEVGRGPLAGPVAVGAFMASTDFDLNAFPYARDSKKMTPESRERCFKEIKAEVEKGGLGHAVSFVSSRRIDKIGLSKAIQTALNSSLRKLKLNSTECLVLLDGGLRASKKYIYQRTIIKGDDKEKIISLASIVAKVLRDRKMVHLSKKHPSFNFHKHKGYGTLEHRRLIRKIGISSIHRQSFLTKILPVLHPDNVTQGEEKRNSARQSRYDDRQSFLKKVLQNS